MCTLRDALPCPRRKCEGSLQESEITTMSPCEACKATQQNQPSSHACTHSCSRATHATEARGECILGGMRALDLVGAEVRGCLHQNERARNHVIMPTCRGKNAIVGAATPQEQMQNACMAGTHSKAITSSDSSCIVLLEALAQHRRSSARLQSVENKCNLSLPWASSDGIMLICPKSRRA